MQIRERPQAHTTPEIPSPDLEEKSYRVIFFGAMIYIITVVLLFMGVVVFMTGL